MLHINAFGLGRRAAPEGSIAPDTDTTARTRGHIDFFVCLEMNETFFFQRLTTTTTTTTTTQHLF
jgi:hypothetical protein